ncbi:hypothetical protein EAF04_002424 [Stromatinia cepivora]|nr:hypothetical protein EAF04_002424 [Stromatinia cepivora]
MPTTPLWSTSYATTSIPEAAIYIPVDINTGFDSCETKIHPFSQCDLEMSTVNITGNVDTNNRTTALSPPHGFSEPLPSNESKETSAKVIRDRNGATF